MLRKRVYTSDKVVGLRGSTRSSPEEPLRMVKLGVDMPALTESCSTLVSPLFAIRTRIMVTARDMAGESGSVMRGSDSSRSVGVVDSSTKMTGVRALEVVGSETFRSNIGASLLMGITWTVTGAEASFPEGSVATARNACEVAMVKLVENRIKISPVSLLMLNMAVPISEKEKKGLSRSLALTLPTDSGNGFSSMT